MIEWVSKSINEIGEVVSGSTPSTSVLEFWNGNVLWFTPLDLSRNNKIYLTNSERKISTEGLNNISNRLIPPYSLIISTRAPIGYLGIPVNPFTTNQGCKTIIFNKGTVPEFFYYFFSYYNHFLKRFGEGTTFLEISKKDLEKLKVIFPKSESEQNKIVNHLITIDKVILKTEATIEKYKAIKQGMIHDFFTRGIDIKTGKLRPRYEEAPELYQPSDLGFIPKEWSIKTTEELLLIKGRIGWRGLKKDEFIESGPYLITGMHFIDDKIDWANCFHISEFRYEESPEIMVQVGDVLITKDGTIGKVAYIDFLPGKASLNSHLLLLRPRNQTQLFSKYLFYELLYTRFRRYIENFKTGSTLAGLSQSAFEKYIFPLPEFEEQEIICNKLISLDKKIDSEIAYLQKLQKIKQGLMQDLLTGKKRVKAKEIN